MTPTASTTRIRRARTSDIDAVMALFDAAIAWLAATGNSGQWGSTPWSTRQTSADGVRREFASADAWVAERPGLGVCGGLVLGAAMPYVAPADVPETYIRVLVGSRDPRARGVGAELLDHARERATADGSRRLRLDCYAGGDGGLVEYYRARGFRVDQRLDVDDWPAAVMSREHP